MILPNPSEFIFRDCLIGGDECSLIFPSHLGVTWTQDNLYFRSVIIRKFDNRVISAGLPKFLNFGEKPHLYPDPLTFNDGRVTTKEDGSCIIVSKHNLEPIVRTRGTVSVDQHSTGPEIHGLISKYRILESPLFSRGEYSAIFEHTTPNCPIVIRYEKPELTLLKIIKHEDYSYLSPNIVDYYALEWGVRRPEVHSFTSLTDIVETCKNLRGIEGFVFEYNSGRNMVKIKGLEYLKLHSFRSHVSIPNLLDLYFAQGCPDLATFQASIARDFDFECLSLANPIIIQIIKASEIVQEKLRLLETYVTPLRSLIRRDAALMIQKDVDKPYQSSAFMMLSERHVDAKQARKLMEILLEPEPVSVTV